MMFHWLIIIESYNFAFQFFIGKFYATLVSTHATRITEEATEIQQ